MVAGDMAAFDKMRTAVNAGREKRSQEEREAITASFGAVLDTGATRALVNRSLVFKVAPPK